VGKTCGDRFIGKVISLLIAGSVTRLEEISPFGEKTYQPF
jgi:hypothetical protein